MFRHRHESKTFAYDLKMYGDTPSRRLGTFLSCTQGSILIVGIVFLLRILCCILYKCEYGERQGQIVIRQGGRADNPNLRLCGRFHTRLSGCPDRLLPDSYQMSGKGVCGESVDSLFLRNVGRYAHHDLGLICVGVSSWGRDSQRIRLSMMGYSRQMNNPILAAIGYGIRQSKSYGYRLGLVDVQTSSRMYHRGFEYGKIEYDPCRVVCASSPILIGTCRYKRNSCALVGGLDVRQVDRILSRTRIDDLFLPDRGNGLSSIFAFDDFLVAGIFHHNRGKV